MACLITTISNPHTNSQYDLGDNFNVTWANNNQCGSYRVTEIKLQKNVSGSWVNESTLWTGKTQVSANTQAVSLPNSTSAYGDIFRVRVKYELVGR